MSQNATVTAFTVPPVVKAVRVRCPPAVAFDRFTRDIHAWWPVRSHSLGKDTVVHVGFEPRVGGRLFERSAAGDERLWGTVTVWEPPSRLAFTWHVGRDADTAQTVTLSFVAHDDGGTDVQLVHSGWEHLGADAKRLRDEYNGGWNLVFAQRYRDHADTDLDSDLSTPRSHLVKQPQFVVIHSPGPSWRAGVTLFEQPGLQAHIDHFRKLYAEGKLALGGPFLDDDGGGMMIAKPGVGKDELTAFAAADPAVESGLLTFKVRPWMVGMDASAGH